MTRPSAMRTTKRTANRARARDRLESRSGGGRMRTGFRARSGRAARTLPRARAYGAAPAKSGSRPAPCRLRSPAFPRSGQHWIPSLVVGAPCRTCERLRRAGLASDPCSTHERDRPRAAGPVARGVRDRSAGARPLEGLRLPPAGPPRPHRSRRRSRPRSSAVRPGAYRQAPRWSIRAREFLGPSLVAWLRYFVADLRDPFFSQRGRFRALLPNLILHVLRSLAQPATALGSALAVERVRDGNTGGRRRGDTSQDENPRGRRRTGRPAGRVLSPLANGLGGLSRRFLCVSGRATGTLAGLLQRLSGLSQNPCQVPPASTTSVRVEKEHRQATKHGRDDCRPHFSTSLMPDVAMPRFELGRARTLGGAIVQL